MKEIKSKCNVCGEKLLSPMDCGGKTFPCPTCHYPTTIPLPPHLIPPVHSRPSIITETLHSFKSAFGSVFMRYGTAIGVLGFLFICYLVGSNNINKSVRGEEIQSSYYIQLSPNEASQLSDRTVINVNSILREIGASSQQDKLLIVKFCIYKQNRPFHSQFNPAWTVDIMNAAKYLNIDTTTTQALDLAWNRSGCQ
jgi:hypothetical protein